MNNKKIEVVMHVLAHELHELQRVVEQIKRSLAISESAGLNTEEWSFFFALNVSKDYYNWEESEIKIDFFCEKFEQLASLLPNAETKIVYDGDYGTNSVKRERIKNTKSDFLCLLDPDIHFSLASFYYITEGIKKYSDEAPLILSAQITRLWDDDYNMIGNNEFIEMGVESKIWEKYNPYKVDSFSNSKPIGFKKLPVVIFGMGWLNTIDIKLLRSIGIPDSFGAYGREDTFICQVCNDLKHDFNEPIQQIVIDNLLVVENRLYEEQFQPYLKYLKVRKTAEDIKSNHGERIDEFFNDEVTKRIQQYIKDTGKNGEKWVQKRSEENAFEKAMRGLDCL